MRAAPGRKEERSPCRQVGRIRLLENGQGRGDAASTEYNLDLTFEAPLAEEDYAAQNRMIENVVRDGADAIVFSAVDFERTLMRWTRLRPRV